MARYVLRGGTLVDGTGRDPIKDTAIVVDGERIGGIWRTRDLPPTVAAGAEIVDVRGKTILPGLINSHEHLTLRGLLSTPGYEEEYYRYYRQPAAYQLIRTARSALICLAQGQTAVRDAGAMDQLAIATRNGIDLAVLVGPRVYTCGSPISIPYQGIGVKPAGMTVDAEGPEGVAAVARDLLAKGADYIKIKGHRRDFDSVERTRLYSRDELAAAAEVAHANGRKVTFHAWHTAIIRWAVELGADAVEHGNPLADEPDLAAAMADRGTFLIPNLRSWVNSREPDAVRNKQAGIPLERIWESVALAIRAGVKLGIGTDLRTPNMVDEMEAMIELGLTPMQAIVAATRHGAEILGKEDALGTLEVGKLADLVVVNSDPLTSLEVLREPSLVVKGGVRHHPAALQEAIGPSAVIPIA